jgi:hypothetical protein
MAFVAKVKTYTLQFEEGHEFHGLEARVAGMTLGEFMEVTEGGAETAAAALKRFADHLISWNLEDEHGNPVPTTEEALRQQDHDLVLALNNAWVQHVVGVHDADPLPETSTSGAPSLEVSAIPMEALSPSLAS